MPDKHLFAILKISAYLCVLLYLILSSLALDSPPLPEGGPYPQPIPFPSYTP